jgi:reactive intermediate/imine deaminase
MLGAMLGGAAGMLAMTAPAEAQGRGPRVTYHQPDGPPQYPFSPAVQVGPIVYLAGQIGDRADGTLAPGGIEAETKQTMENIKTILGKIGLTMDDVVKCTIFIADMAEWGRMNSVYRTYFKVERLPARSAFGANGLALGARVEIECVAAARMP